MPRIYPWRKWGQVGALIAAGTLIFILGADLFNQDSSQSTNATPVASGGIEASSKELTLNQNFQLPEKPKPSSTIAEPKLEKKKTRNYFLD